MPLSSADAVLRYAVDFIPSWAGAIAIDLLPAVLVGIMAVVHGAMRRGEDELEDADRVTAGDMLRSLDLHEALRQAQAAAQMAAAKPLSDDRRRLETSRTCGAAPDRRECHAADARRTKAGRSVSDTPAMRRRAYRADRCAGSREHARRQLRSMRYLSRFDDGEVVRWAFRGLLIGTIGVLALDLQRPLAARTAGGRREACRADAPADADPAAGRRDRTCRCRRPIRAVS